ncbi:Alpha/Beta hydrolase protein [Pilobolus umbonatus]|nr:Alpha/Beta hydrolase protein [Pilobolus umbonatus]
MWTRFKQWLTSWTLSFCLVFPNTSLARKMIHMLQVVFFKERLDWIVREPRGYWVAEDLKKDAKREAISDRVSESDIIVLWIPGGGFRYDFGRFYTGTFATWIRALEADKRIKSMFFVADYTRENVFPAAVKDIAYTYEWLIETYNVDPSKIIIAGDDVGVAIVLDTLKLKIDKDKRPAGMICVSPYTGLEAGGESWRYNLGGDLINENAISRMEAAYLGPEGSRYEDDLLPFEYLDKEVQLGSFLPKKLLVYLGGKEVLLDEGGLFASRAMQTGVTVQVVQERSGIHLWPLFPDIFVNDITTRQNIIDKFTCFVNDIVLTNKHNK